MYFKGGDKNLKVKYLGGKVRVGNAQKPLHPWNLQVTCTTDTLLTRTFRHRTSGFKAIAYPVSKPIILLQFCLLNSA
jgi:hypothetical protein